MTVSRQNLFLTTRRLTTAHEDHLTEFFASALETNAAFAKSYIDLLLASRDATWGPQTTRRCPDTPFWFGAADAKAHWPGIPRLRSSARPLGSV